MNGLNRKINFWSLIRFSGPTILMMIFMSLYTMVDGIFVSNVIGTDALSAINIAYPLLNLVLAVGIMLATGGSAIVAKRLGQGKQHEAKRSFTFIFMVGVIMGVLLLIFGQIFLDNIIRLLGASEKLFAYCKDYLFILVLFVPFGMMQMLFQFFFVTAGKPIIGMVCVIGAGITNIILDYVFIVVLGMGISGAALATGIGYTIPSIVGILYFSINRKGAICFTKFKPEMKILLKAMGNGSSEMVTNLAMSIVTFLFNYVMMQRLGEDGVAAITIILYSEFLLSALFFGFSSGVAPLISFNYGNKNYKRLRKISIMSFLFVASASAVVFVLALIFNKFLIMVFAPVGSNVYNIAASGFKYFSFAYIFMGINIFASALFTAFLNGKVSAIISFLRSFAILAPSILLLPLMLGDVGVFLSVPIAEGISLIASGLFIFFYRKKYAFFSLKYIKEKAEPVPVPQGV